MNTYGRLFRLTTFGESHGTAIGGVIDGCPAGLQIDTGAIQTELDLRRPGTSVYTSARREPDRVEILSGVYAGVSTGAPIAFLIPNEDPRPMDYAAMQRAYRPGHADYTYDAKYGIRDVRGGGRSSARETACRTVAGALARQLLLPFGIRIQAYISRIGGVALASDVSYIRVVDIREQVYASPVRCPDADVACLMMQEIEKAKAEGDSLGGIVSCEVSGVPVGWGEPLYDKLSARLAEAMMGINAAKAFELGDGFGLSSSRGSRANDAIMPGESTGNAIFETNHSGGILGGISTGQDIRFRVGFKPTSTIAIEQKTIDRAGRAVSLSAKGRHDPCVAIRAVAVVEAMCAMVLADAFLMARSSAPIA